MNKEELTISKIQAMLSSEPVLLVRVEHLIVDSEIWFTIEVETTIGSTSRRRVFDFFQGDEVRVIFYSGARRLQYEKDPKDGYRCTELPVKRRKSP